MAEIIDGDTVELAECELRLRLALVDAPERGEPGFEEATSFTAGRCPLDETVLVDLDAGQPLDTTGTRLVGVLLCDGANVNADLVAAGLAVIDARFCDRSEFADDDWAREACA
jgi:micrococcal nuclease